MLKSTDVWTRSFIKYTKNEWFLLSVTTMAKIELVIVLTQESALS